MLDELDKKLEYKIESKLKEIFKRGKLQDGFKKNKVINEVLDKPTMLTLLKMINLHIISYVNGIIKAGKESVLFWAKDTNGNDVALKIYLVTTSNFKKRSMYILGDPRFNKIRKGTRNLVYTWAKKEFRNLSQCWNVQIPVPRPIHVSNNVLAMDFIGNEGTPAKTLQESNVFQTDYEFVLSILSLIYKKAKLVHGDFSEYNIFKTNNGLVVFDFGSAVDIRHPNSSFLLKRDINNINRFFVKRGLKVQNAQDVYEEITN